MTQQANEQQQRLHTHMTMAGGGKARPAGRGGRVLAAVVVLFMVVVTGFVVYVALTLMGTM